MTHAMTGAARIEAAIRGAAPKPALVAYLTAGYPTRAAFRGLLAEVAGAADVVEVGIPFSDPMADGATIQEASRVALEQGTSLAWVLDELASMPAALATPVLLMSYMNPVLRFGFDKLAHCAAASRVSGVIIPDLPFDESVAVAAPLRAAGVAVVQMATPVSAAERVARVASGTEGFLYAVTTTGTTGRGTLDAAGVTGYLDGLRALSRAPVCAGFGIRSAAHVGALAGHCDGVIVGSALVEAIGRGESPGALLRSLRG